MHTYLRIAGGFLFLIALFWPPLRYDGSDSAFQLAAHHSDPESIAVFVASMMFGMTAAISTFFTRRVVEWLEMLLTIVAAAGIVFFILRFGIRTHHGLSLSWSGIMLVGGLLLIAIGANGRYRNASHG